MKTLLFCTGLLLAAHIGVAQEQPRPKETKSTRDTIRTSAPSPAPARPATPAKETRSTRDTIRTTQPPRDILRERRDSLRRDSLRRDSIRRGRPVTPPARPDR